MPKDQNRGGWWARSYLAPDVRLRSASGEVVIEAHSQILVRTQLLTY